MKRFRTIPLAIAISAASVGFGQDWNRLPGGDVISGTEYLGARAGSLVPLRLKPVANQPIDFSTADLFRARINEKTSYPIGSASNDPRDGFTLLSGRSDYLQYRPGPFTRLHLVDDVGANNPTTFAQDIGYRSWMRNGITFTGNSDQAYAEHPVRQCTAVV